MTTKVKSELREIPLSQIKTNGNVRTVTSNTEDKELAKSVQEKGVIEPIIIRKEGTVLIAGHRRLAAAKVAKLKAIPARVMDVTEQEALEIQVIENLQRKDLTPLEEAEAYAKLLEQNGTEEVWDHKGKKTLPSKEFERRVGLLAKTVGKNKTHIMRVLRLIELPSTVKNWIKSGKLTAMHGALLVDLPDESRQKVIAKHLAIEIRNMAPGDTYPVSELKNYIERTFERKLTEAPFPVDCEFAGQVACTACPYNSGNAMSLFAGASLGNCRQNTCWNKKRDQVYRDIKAEVEKKNKVISGTKVRFVGYSKMVSDFSGTRIPYRVKNFPVLPEKLNGTTKLAKAVEKNPELFGWTLVKPAQDSKKPDCKVLFVTRSVADTNKLLGLKMKEKDAKESGKGHTQAGNVARENYQYKKLNEATQEAVIKELKTLKPSENLLRTLLVFEYGDEDMADEISEAAKVVGVKIPKTKKDEHAFEKMKLSDLGLVLVSAKALRYGGWDLLGIDKEALQEEIFEKAGAEYDALQEKEAAKK